MMTFRQGLTEFKVPLSTVWLMNDIAEAKGWQDLDTKQSPQILKALREMALLQSVESSNRIEGEGRCQRDGSRHPTASIGDHWGISNPFLGGSSLSTRRAGKRTRFARRREAERRRA